MVALRGVVFAALVAVAVGLVAFAPGGDAGVSGAPAVVPSLASGGERATAAQTPAGGASTAYGKLPLAFEPNRGQSDGRVRFLSRGAGYGLFLTAGEAVLSLRPQPAKTGSDAAAWLTGGSPDAMSAFAGISQARGAVLRFGLVGANLNARVSGAGRLPGVSNYMRGNDPRRWQTAIPHYGKVRYASVYPGTDLVYYGRQGQLEYDFVLAPGADPDRIAFSVAGAQRVSIDGRGDLVVRTGAGDVVQRRPVVYQRGGSQRRAVAGRYVLMGRDRVGFRVGAYDRSRPLVIDPVISYSTYLGGSSDDAGTSIKVDASGMYVTGSTGSTNFPTQSPAQGGSGGSDGTSDAFVSKLNSAGSALLYSTYLGGSRADSARGIAVDGSGNAYVTGSTYSINFPTAPAPPAGAPVQLRSGGGSDAFVAKLSAAGALSYSTYLGGARFDEGLAIAVDSGGSAYVTGDTDSASASAVPTQEGFPTKNPLQAANGGSFDAFVSKVTFSGSPLSSDLVYSTFLGGTSDDAARGIAVDSAGSAYVTGGTLSSNFPTASPLQAAKGGNADAFVSKLNAAGSALSYSTYLGGSFSELGYAIAVDAGANAYVAGRTDSPNFPTASPVQAARAGLDGGDAFVSKLNAGGSSLLSSTHLGGSKEDAGSGIAVDSAGSAYVTGTTVSTDFPTSGAPQTANGGIREDAFVSKLSGSGAALSTLAYSTYLGGTGSDFGQGIAADSSGNAYVTGSTYSTNFPTASPLRAANGGGQDAFVTKLIPAADLSITKTDAPDPVLAGQPLTYTLSVQNAGPDVARAVSVSDPLPSGVTLVAASSGCSQATAAGVVTVTCSVGDLAKGASAQREITVRTSQAGTLSNTASVASQTFDPVAANNSSSASTVVSAPVETSADVSITKTDSPDPVRSGELLTYTLTASNAGPDRAEGVVLRDQLPAGVTFVSTASSPECAGTGVVSCTVGGLAKGASEQRQIVVRATVPNPSLSNTATVSSSTGDPLSSNNTATTSTVVQAVADVSVTKSDSPDPVMAGQPLTYTLTASNTGPDVAAAVSLRDRLPAGVQLVSASGCSVTDGVVSCDVGDLASGVSSERKIVVRPTEATPALLNTATVQTLAVDRNSSNDSATASTVVLEAPPPPPGGGSTDPPAGGGPSAGGALLDASPFPPATPPPPGAPPPAAALVALSDQSITPRRFAPARSGPSALAAARKRASKPKVYGAKVSYRLNMAASVRFTVSQALPGRRQGKGKSARCVAQTKRSRKAAKCRRIVTLPGSFILAGKVGANGFRFTGRLANRKLKRGGYTLTATPTANARTGKPANIAFTITR